ncbi:hypothetical protein WJX74_006505 [Apatococcus lobatus]|uniref:Magnesium transporter n=2 Tax=Apatococcus TaxID=904362 RepID=A0AAW1SZ72_9CHLO
MAEEGGYIPLPSSDEFRTLELLDFDNFDHTTALTAPQQKDWLRIDAHGNLELTKVDKHAMVGDLGIHYRDLRTVDPLIATVYPASIFIRDRALVVNLECLRMIVCKDEVFVLGVPDLHASQPACMRPKLDHFFVKELVARLQAPTLSSAGLARVSSIDKRLPYELRALEAGLSCALRLLEGEVASLEAATQPRLERLLGRVSRVELDGVRQSKSNVGRMVSRMTHLKEELEDILDDDQDMADMYIGRREQAAEQQKAHRQASIASTFTDDHSELGDIDEHGPEPSGQGESNWSPSEEKQREAAASLAAKFGETGPHPIRRDNLGRPIEGSSPLPTAESAPDRLPHRPPLHPESQDTFNPAPSAPTMGHSNSAHAHQKTRHSKQPGKWHANRIHQIAAVLSKMDMDSGHGGPEDPNDFRSCENLIEAYFMQVDGLLGRLNSLEAKIRGTEDLINIELDHRRNELVALDLFVTAVMAMFAFVSMIGGIFGMNMKNGYEENRAAFKLTTWSSLVVSFLLFAGILAFARYKRLLFIPDPRTIG